MLARQGEVDGLSSLAQQVLEETYISSRVSVTATQLTARYHSLLLNIQVRDLGGQFMRLYLYHLLFYICSQSVSQFKLILCKFPLPLILLTLTIKTIDHPFLCEGANLQSQQGIRYLLDIFSIVYSDASAVYEIGSSEILVDSVCLSPSLSFIMLKLTNVITVV